MRNVHSETIIAILEKYWIPCFGFPSKIVTDGGNLSPLLFLFYINDLMQCPNTEIIKFADDKTFLVKHHKDEKVDYVNTVVNHMKNWCNKNQIKLNEKKTQIITIKKDRSCIKYELERQRKY